MGPAGFRCGSISENKKGNHRNFIINIDYSSYLHDPNHDFRYSNSSFDLTIKVHFSLLKTQSMRGDVGIFIFGGYHEADLTKRFRMV